MSKPSSNSESDTAQLVDILSGFAVTQRQLQTILPGLRATIDPATLNLVEDVILHLPTNLTRASAQSSRRVILENMMARDTELTIEEVLFAGEESHEPINVDINGRSRTIPQVETSLPRSALRIDPVHSLHVEVIQAPRSGQTISVRLIPRSDAAPLSVVINAASEGVQAPVKLSDETGNNVAESEVRTRDKPAVPQEQSREPTAPVEPRADDKLNDLRYHGPGSPPRSPTSETLNLPDSQPAATARPAPLIRHPRAFYQQETSDSSDVPYQRYASTPTFAPSRSQPAQHAARGRPAPLTRQPRAFYDQTHSMNRAPKPSSPPQPKRWTRPPAAVAPVPVRTDDVQRQQPSLGNVGESVATNTNPPPQSAPRRAPPPLTRQPRAFYNHTTSADPNNTPRERYLNGPLPPAAVPQSQRTLRSATATENAAAGTPTTRSSTVNRPAQGTRQTAASTRGRSQVDAASSIDKSKGSLKRGRSDEDEEAEEKQGELSPSSKKRTRRSGRRTGGK